MDEKIPSWLWFSIMSLDKKWTDEKEFMARRIIEALKDRFKHQPEILKKVLYFNKDDDADMYGITHH